MRCLVPARGGIYAQDAESGGEEVAACMERDGTQVPGEEAEECTHHLVHPVGIRSVASSLPCGCGTGMCAPYDMHACSQEVGRELGSHHINRMWVLLDKSAQPRLEIR